jgi:hypothetical protein
MSTQEPINLSIPKPEKNELPVKSLLEEGFVKRLVGFTNSKMKSTFDILKH